MEIPIRDQTKGQLIRLSYKAGNVIVTPDDEDKEDELRSGSSAKIDQLIHLLQLTPYTEKSLVFSQFTSFLDKVHPK